MKSVLITGCSSGLGHSLSSLFSESHKVFGLSRSECDQCERHKICDLSITQDVERDLQDLLSGIDNIDLVFLNAGILGRLKKTHEIDVSEYNDVLNINFLSNKIIIDYLITNKVVKNIIGISSGAAFSSYFGWSLYCCSKAAFRQLISCYAKEYPDIGFLSLAPGLVKTKMQDFISSHNEEEIPSVKKFKALYRDMQTPNECAHKIYHNIDKLLSIDVDYFDLRELK
jgi:benzil reductase ((S)-benzoin forming)